MYAAVSAACVDSESQSHSREHPKGRAPHQVIQFHRGNTLVNAGNHLLCNASGIYMFRVQAVAQSGNTGSDLIELDTLFAPV